MKVLMQKRKEDWLVKEIRDLGYEISFYKPKEEDKVDYDADIIVDGIWLRHFDFSKFKNLKYIFLLSTGIDYLDLDYLIRNRGIKVTNNHGAYGEPIAEWVLYNILQLEKYDRLNLKNQENKIWTYRSSSGNLYGKTALILGTGAIGRETAKRLKAFDVKTIGLNRSGKKYEEFDEIWKNEEVLKSLKEVDYVISALPDTKETEKFIDKEFLDNLKKEALIINISRGAVIDEKELIKSLQEKRLRGAALDVFETEPLQKDSPLWDMENVYIFPHISFSCEDDQERLFRTALKNLKNLKENKELESLVDIKKGY
ncbi:4-phosphoerythronate dehydrogenase [Clostridiales bacterium KA00134]|nr:4-phosphoerythronate dehydrogenase [Clostridiales bacterium KA00134]